MSEDKKHSESNQPSAGAAPEAEPAAAAPASDGAGPADQVQASDEELIPFPQGELEQLREDNAKLRDQALRAMAEAENVRRRAERDKQEALKYATAGFAKDLLEVADNLARALQAAPEDQIGGNEVARQLRVGVAMTEQQLLEAFAKHGITKIEPLGEKFDPHYHQAMFEMPSAEHPPGTVAQVMQAGYVLNDRLLRPAMVGVAKGPAPQPDESAQRVDTTA